MSLLAAEPPNIWSFPVKWSPSSRSPYLGVESCLSDAENAFDFTGLAKCLWGEPGFLAAGLYGNDELVGLLATSQERDTADQR